MGTHRHHHPPPLPLSPSLLASQPHTASQRTRPPSLLHIYAATTCFASGPADLSPRSLTPPPNPSPLLHTTHTHRAAAPAAGRGTNNKQQRQQQQQQQ